MTVLFFSAQTAEVARPQTLHSALSAEQELSSSADTSRRNSPHMDTHTALSDDAREELIGVYARLMEECVSKAHGPLRAFWLIEAQSWKERMHALIARRSPEYVRSLEIKRGLI